jgi:hypothetical protein
VSAATVAGLLLIAVPLAFDVGPVLMLCALELVGGHEERGWRQAERLTPIAYVVWSLWLIAAGIAMLVA